MLQYHTVFNGLKNIPNLLRFGFFIYKPNGGSKMKKLLLIPVLFLASIISAQQNPDLRQPIYQALTLNAFSVYSNTDFSVTKSSPTAIRYVVTATSISFISTGGLHAGVTGYMLTDYTIKQFVDYLNTVSATLDGVEGGLKAELSTGCYSGDTLEMLSAQTGSSILGLSAKKVVTQGSTKGISITLPKKSNIKNHITNGLVNATFANGSMSVYAYDGATSTNTVIDRESFSGSGVDAVLEFNDIGYTVNKFVNTPILFEMYGSTNITAGYVVLNYFAE